MSNNMFMTIRAAELGLSKFENEEMTRLSVELAILKRFAHHEDVNSQIIDLYDEKEKVVNSCSTIRQQLNMIKEHFKGEK